MTESNHISIWIPLGVIDQSQLKTGMIQSQGLSELSKITAKTMRANDDFHLNVGSIVSKKTTFFKTWVLFSGKIPTFNTHVLKTWVTHDLHTIFVGF